MKKIYSFLCMLLLITFAYGQNKKTEKADKLYDGYQFVDAIEEYLKLVDDATTDSYIYKRLADSYFKVFNIKEAAKWYLLALKENQDAETHYRYALVLKSQGDYEQANEQMDLFSIMEPNDIRAKAHLENPNYMPQLADISQDFSVEETTINDDSQSDFGAVLSNDNLLYFASTRATSKEKDKWTKEPYLNIYRSVRDSDGSMSEPEPVEELNTIYHDGPLSISADGKTMYFSRDGHSEKSFKKIKKNRVKLAQQGIYKAIMIDGKWGNIEALPINSRDYTVSHPSISSDGKTLYFASNMPGGMGDTDIWKISVNSNTYGEPVNLGSNVNTSGKEAFPYISDDNILYFASSGLQGFGGYDLFKCDLNTNKAAENLGNAINTKRDDFAFSVNNTKKIGYFSSNRSGVDNIYVAIPICKYEAITLVKDADTYSLIANVKVSVFDAMNNEISAETTDISGKTSFNVSCETTYYIRVSKDGYETTTYKLGELNSENVSTTIDLNPINELITETEVKLNNIYFEFNQSNITNRGALELDKLVKIMKDYPEMKILVRSHTDSKGSSAYNLTLSEQRAQATVQYVISKGINKERLSAKGIGSKEPKVVCSNCTEDEDAQNRRSEFLILKN